MVYTLDLDTNSVMELDEYVEFVEQNVDVRDLDSIVAGAPALRALANNRTFLLDLYHDQLTAYWADPTDGRALPQSIVPARRENFYVRANIWLPITGYDEKTEWERNLYSYDVAHDHNYHFATVGYYGPGYETDIFEYDYDKVLGYEGEQVELTPLGRYQLTPGRVMVYRAGKDIHIQHPPRDVSVSLNLMCRADDTNSPQQYLFDVRRSVLLRGAGDVVSMRLFLLDTTKYIHNDETVGILSDFAEKHICARTRGYALTILDQLDPQQGERLRSKVSPETLRYHGLPLVNGSDVIERH